MSNDKPADRAWNDPVKLRAAMRRLQNALADTEVEFANSGRRDEYVRAWRRMSVLLDRAAKAERAAAKPHSQPESPNA